VSGFLIDTNVLSEYNRIGGPDVGKRRRRKQMARKNAATALAYELTIVTRNTKDFEGIGAATVNPWHGA